MGLCDCVYGFTFEIWCEQFLKYNNIKETAMVKTIKLFTRMVSNKVPIVSSKKETFFKKNLFPMHFDSS